jgi:molybdate transport system substrate-binding protein
MSDALNRPIDACRTAVDARMPLIGRDGAATIARDRRRFVASALKGAAIALVPGASHRAFAADAPLVAAASDLRFALDEIAGAFARDGGGALRIVYGSSGDFRRQIAIGAPFELYLSADESYVLALAREGKLVDDGTIYAIGRIALVVPRGSPLALDATLADLASAVAAGRVKKFAIANPEHAPYGRAAREALTAAGVWAAIEPRLVLGENVSQAAQFAVSGSAQGGLVALSLALAPRALGDARHVAVPASMHAPLRQRMALTRRAGALARAFYDYLQQPAPRAVLRRFGFATTTE